MLKELAQHRSDELKQMRKGRLLEIAMNGTNSILPIVAKITTYSVYVRIAWLNQVSMRLIFVPQALVTKGDLSGELLLPIKIPNFLNHVFLFSIAHVLFANGKIIITSLLFRHYYSAVVDLLNA